MKVTLQKSEKICRNLLSQAIYLNKEKIRLGASKVTKCPKCRSEVVKPSKKWKYQQFTVESFECACGTKFREYSRDGKRSFTLKFSKGKDKHYVKP